MVFRPTPGHPPADKHVELGRSQYNGRCQCFLRLLDASALTERRRQRAHVGS